MGVKQSAVSLYLKLSHEKIKSEIEQISKDRPVLAHNMLSLPIGTLVGNALNEEAANVVITDTIWIKQAMNAAAIQKVGLSKAILAPVIAVTTVVTASAAVFVGVYTNSNDPPQYTEPPAVHQDYDYTIPADGRIEFTGGDTNREHVNPEHATAWVNNDFDVLAAYNWWITAAESEDVLYGSKNGDAIETVFIQMRDSGKDGQYMVHFTFENESKDVIYKVSRQFEIQSGS